MKGHARETIFWPGLNRDIDNITNCCEQCHQYQNKQKSERVIPHEIPLVPWTKVGTDLFASSLSRTLSLWIIHQISLISVNFLINYLLLL